MLIVCNINLDRYLKKFHKDGAKQSAVASKKNSLKKTLSQTKNCSHVSQNVIAYGHFNEALLSENKETY
jgi:hypothetical protein